MEQSGHVDIDTHHLMSFLVFAAFGSSSCVAVSSLLEQALVFCFNSACIFAIVGLNRDSQKVRNPRTCWSKKNFIFLFF